MADSVSRILESIPAAGNPPLHLWQPELSGDIDIVIKSDGTWVHEGGEIKRQNLVNLFASILRFEADIGFVLVTPVEKWRIVVEDAPFIAVAVDQRDDDLWFAINIGTEVKLGAEHKLSIQAAGEAVSPYIEVRPSLQAKLSRPVYYQLADYVVEHNGLQGVWSGGKFFSLDLS